MTLEDFEKSLAESKASKEEHGSRKEHEGSRRHRKHLQESDDPHRHKRRRRSREDEGHGRHHRRHRDKHDHHSSHKELTLGHEDELTGKSEVLNSSEQIGLPLQQPSLDLKRDTWMEAPSALDVDFTQKGAKRSVPLTTTKPAKSDFDLKIHHNELNKNHLQNLADGVEVQDEELDKPAQHEVDYIFGDAGAQWRMTKLKAIFRQAEESGRSVDEIALEKYGDLRDFDDAREEQIELERRGVYGNDYVGKEKPSGELFQERKMAAGIRREHMDNTGSEDLERARAEITSVETVPPLSEAPIDQTALNRLKARMMKAQLSGSPNVKVLEAEYIAAASAFINPIQSNVVVLGTMENRMLAGGRKGEVKEITSKRGRERGLVEENENMSIEDMVREEKRTRGQAGGEGQRFAERIAKDGKFDNDLDYMDENANKLAKRVQKSEINLKNTAISDFQKMNRILDSCPLCHHEDTNTPPTAPVVSLGTRVYLTLPTEPEISDGGACIIPIQHRSNLLECDDDEWEEIRNFMKSLTRMYHDQGRSVVFYENAAVPTRKKHAGMEAVPLPYDLGDTAPAFFKEAILIADEEWTQHKKLIDTLAKARQGLGKMAFRRTLVKEMPYFHVWFEIDGGLGHVVEDATRWPKGDLFAREIIGGMLDVGMDVVKKQGRWNRGDKRVDGFRKRWKKFDWTRVLTDS